ncbi:MAG: hypothetical protein JWR08_448, partial [Enterovirga sp.]|nr:hypothetical protein [Enterovirga sp.]
MGEQAGTADLIGTVDIWRPGDLGGVTGHHSDRTRFGLARSPAAPPGPARAGGPAASAPA